MMRQQARRAFFEYGMAVASVSLAVAVRAALDPLLGPLFPFATVFFAVLLTAWYGGFAPALAATVLGGLLSAWYLMPPTHTLHVAGFENQAGLVLYLAVSLGIALLGGGMRRAQRRTQAQADAAVTERERLRITLASIGDAVIVCDDQARVTALNAVAEQLTGWPAADALGQSLTMVFSIINEGTRQPVENPALRVLREGVIVGLANHTLLVARDGTARPIDDSAAPIRTAAGRVNGVVLVFRDVSGRRQAEKRLRDSEERLRRVVENMPVLLDAFDAAGRIVVWNRECERVTGYSAAEMVGNPHALDVLYPDADYRTRMLAEWQQRGNDYQGWEWEVTARDGSRRVVAWSNISARFPIPGWSNWGVGVDVTDRQAAVEALRQSEEHFRLLADGIPQLVWMARPDGHIFWYNRRWYDYTGTTPAAMEGWGWQTVHDPAALPTVLERWRQSIASGAPFEMVFPLRGADGVFRSFLTRVLPLRRADGTLVSWFGTNTDVTAIRDAEEQLRRQVERLRLLSESAAHLLYATEPDALARGLFERVKEHLGADAYFNFMVNETGDALQLESCAGIPAEEARRIGRLEFGQAICGTVAMLRQPIVAEDIQQSVDPKLQFARGYGFRAYVGNPLMAGDRLLGTLSFASRSRDRFDADELEFIRTLCHYVTVAYERLRLVSELRETDRRKDEFLATLAHELRNPLAPVRNGLQILRLAGHNPQAQEQARAMMDRQVAQMVRLIDDLLDLSRITRGRIELRRERVELAAVVHSALEISRPPIDASGHQLAVTVPPEPLPVEVDPTRLAQVLSNLLNNAAKYTPEGGRIWLTAGQEGDAAVLRVRDDGIGIPAAMLPHIFEMFTQAERGRGGLGIGLTLVRRLVELHGGSVEAHSGGPGQGSEFVVRLPLPTRVPPAPLPAAPATGAPSAAGRRILIVDDNQDSADSLATLLQMLGNVTATAYDGSAGLKLAQEMRPDLVLLDIGMPGLDGYEVARRLRQQPEFQNVTLCAMTGWGQEEDRRKSRAAGFDHHLVKPVDLTALQPLLDGAPAST